VATDDPATFFQAGRTIDSFPDTLIYTEGKNGNELTNLKIFTLDGRRVLSKGVLRGMMKARRGRIINIASIVGLIGNPGQANYCAAKAGIIGFTRSLAREVASRGITANVVAPGFVDTDMTRGLPDEQRAALAARIPLTLAGRGVGAGAATPALVETVDLYPTLTELAGLPARAGLDGVSFASVLKEPTKAARDSVIHVYPRNDKLGRAIRTERYRLVEWKKIGAPADTAELELYDYQTDPLETRNLAADQPEGVAQLRAILAQHPEAKPQLPSGGVDKAGKAKKSGAGKKAGAKKPAA
jgi:hypothetical protein